MFLRRRLTCFYCGQGSTQRRADGLRQWQCQSCEAINYLDANGNVTEPPLSDTLAPTSRYATRGDRVTSPELGSPLDPIFCNTCLKNQYLVTHNLSEYLPELEDPRYPEYERNLPSYRAKLEARYPQVCRDCEPRVRARLRATGYAAKTDHLRRLAETTRRDRKRASSGNAPVTLMVLGCLFWWLAFILQVLWHSTELYRLNYWENIEFPSEESGSNAWKTNLHELGQYLLNNELVSWAAVISFALTICSLWWNPTLMHSSWRQTTGWREFYKLQAILGAARLLAWRVLQGDETVADGTRTRRMIHATALVFNIFVIFVSLRTLRSVKSPTVSFESPNETFVVETIDPHRAALRPVTPEFPLQKLSGVTHTLQIQEEYTPLASPPEDLCSDDETELGTIETSTVDSDAMDLDTPDRRNVSWKPRQTRTWQSIQDGISPSPFRGHLPPAPVSQSHRLRNPPNKPVFQKAPESRQKAFFESMAKAGGAMAEPTPGTGDTNNARDVRFAPPQFFAPSQEETGLEALFSGIINLSDEPQELQHKGVPQEAIAAPHNAANPTFTLAFVETILLGFAVTQLYGVGRSSPHGLYLRIAILTAISIESLYCLFDRLRPSRPVWLLSDAVFYTGELAISAWILSRSLLSQGNADANVLGQGPERTLIAVFAAQKLYKVARGGFDYHRIACQKGGAGKNQARAGTSIVDR